MGEWRADYERKLMTAEEAVKVVRSGDKVAFGRGREPEALGLALAARAAELRDVEVFIPTPALDFGWYDSGFEESFRIKISYAFPRGVVREWFDERRGDYLVGSIYSSVRPQFMDSDEKTVDVLLIELSPPDEHGYCSFGTSLWDKKHQVRRARTVLAEINDRLIRTYGDNYVHVSEIGAFVEHSRGSGWGIKPPQAPPEAAAICEHLKPFVRDGDTIQFGAGTVSEALPSLGLFAGRFDLGVHTEMTARGIVALVREGVVNGKRKTLHRGKVVATAVGGMREDLQFINQNPIFEVYEQSYVSDPRTIAANDNMLCVNMALAVDLTGQISAESLGHRMYSGSGGQPAFAIGAQLSRGGRYFVVLPSATSDGAQSRIVAHFEPGTIVTVPRTLADYVVTEHGVAALRGKSVRERAEALIAIAHPDHRAGLSREAQRLYWP
ncbi:MAG: 4-hydroxybutyrate CoA-transferase [Chloroflexi bacterium]|nr:4-hydroxybutyrate CoA-transferase [Chloroflexota bacterium]